jgi:sugar phosphate isomerase/epimerase
LRGAIVGHGDIDMWKVIEIVKRSGYDGYVSIEFEGMEDCRLGSRIGMENARRIWDAV